MLYVDWFAMQVLKFYAWEPAFENRILQLREKELQLIRRSSVAYGFNQVLSVLSANIVSLIIITRVFFRQNAIEPLDKMYPKY